MRTVGAVAALLRRLRVEREAVLLLFVLVAVTSFLVAISPRLFQRVSDDGLQYELADSTVVQRNLQFSTVSHVPAQSGSPFARVEARGQEIWERLPASVQAIVDQRRFAVETPRFVLLDPPNYATSVAFQYQDGIEEQVTFEAGRRPLPVTPRTDDAGVPRFEVALSTATAEAILVGIGDVLRARVDASDPMLRRIWPRPVTEIDFEVVGLYRVDELEDPFWFGESRMARIAVTGTEEFPLALASAMFAPGAYPDFRELGLPMSYRWRYFVATDRIDDVYSRNAHAGPTAPGIDLRIHDRDAGRPGLSHRPSGHRGPVRGPPGNHAGSGLGRSDRSDRRRHRRREPHRAHHRRAPASIPGACPRSWRVRKAGPRRPAVGGPPDHGAGGPGGRGPGLPGGRSPARSVIDAGSRRGRARHDGPPVRGRLAVGTSRPTRSRTRRPGRAAHDTTSAGGGSDRRRCRPGCHVAPEGAKHRRGGDPRVRSVPCRRPGADGRRRRVDGDPRLPAADPPARGRHRSSEGPGARPRPAQHRSPPRGGLSAAAGHDPHDRDRGVLLGRRDEHPAWPARGIVAGGRRRSQGRGGSRKHARIGRGPGHGRWGRGFRRRVQSPCPAGVRIAGQRHRRHPPCHRAGRLRGRSSRTRRPRSRCRR